MTRFLAFVSLVFLSLLPCHAQTDIEVDTAEVVEVDDTATDEAVNEYTVLIDARGHQITGIAAIRFNDDDTAVGTIVNEMGVKAFDFVYDGRKAKLRNVFPPLNKWYIKKVIRKDIAFLIANINGKETVRKGKRIYSVSPEGEISVKNEKFRISYTFNRIKRHKGDLQDSY